MDRKALEKMPHQET